MLRYKKPSRVVINDVAAVKSPEKKDQAYRLVSYKDTSTLLKPILNPAKAPAGYKKDRQAR
jgi:hypothetical protein